MNRLHELYGVRPPNFIEGFIAALEFYSNTGRMQLTLYGRPILRAALEAEKSAVAVALSPEGENP